MEPASQLSCISRQLSGDSTGRNGRMSFQRNLAFSPQPGNAVRFSFGRQSSLAPNRGNQSPTVEELTVPGNLDSTMQLLFLASQGEADGVDEILKEGIDVNSIDLDGRTALHIAACEGHVDVVKLLLSWRANVDARDRWGSTAVVDAKYYGNLEIYNILRARGAQVPKTTKTPMTVSNPQEVPEYELNPGEIQIRRGEEVLKGTYQVAKWNGTKVSVKILDKESLSDPDSVNAFNYELNLLQKVRHPNVIQFVGAITQNIPMMIVSEYHPKDDLGTYLQKKGRLQIHKVLRYALEIARGMNYLHQCKPDPIIHCDLKPKNILFDCVGQLKVVGFGIIKLSNVAPDKAKLANFKAQVDSLSLYVAPEVYRDEIFDISVDTFSFSLILYEMIVGTTAFHPKSPEEVVRMICLDGMRPPLKCKSKRYPPEIKERLLEGSLDKCSRVPLAFCLVIAYGYEEKSWLVRLIEECWDSTPTVRPTFSEIIARLDKIYATCIKQGRWKDTFKLPWK